MAAVALIVFDQGGPGPAGQAFEGTVAGGAVTVDNDDDTDVTSFTFTMLDVPPGSAVATGTMATGGPPSTASFTPDVSGSYRVQLEVSGASTSDKDIRCFGIRNARGIIIPPYQRNPEPLPLPGSGLPGAKPDEQNYGGQTRGWAGDRSSGQLEEYFLTYDDLPFTTVTATPFTAAAVGEPPLYLVDLTAIGSNAIFNLPTTGWRVGQRFRVVHYTGTNYILSVVPPGGHNINGLSQVDMLWPAGGDFLYLGGVNWLMPSASWDTYERSLVAGVENVDVTGFQSIGASILLNPAQFPNGTFVWNVVIETSNAADAAEIRLYNVTLGAVVAGAVLSTTNLTPTPLSAAFTPAVGPNLYSAQLRLQTTGAPNIATCRQAQVTTQWMQP